MSWVVSRLLELQCNWKVWKVENHIHAGASKRNYVLYTIYPPKKNCLSILTLLNAWGLVTGTAVLPDEKCLSFKTEVYLLLSMFSENCLWSDLKDFLLRPYAATERKPNVSLADRIRCCLFTQWLRVTLACFAFCSLYFTVCKNRYTHSLIIPQYSVGSSALKKAKRDGSLFKVFVEQFGNPSSTASK